MKKALLLVAVLGLVASASADVKIYFSPVSGPAGLTNDAVALQPTAGAHQDYLYDSGYPDYAQLPGPYNGVTFPTAFDTPTVGIGEPVYIWFKINETTAWNGFKIQGLGLDLKATSGAEPALNDGSVPDARIANIAYYVMDNTSGVGSHTAKRWDGDQTANTFQKDKISLTAVTAYGILNSTTANAGNLYQAGVATGATSRVALLGAVSFNAPGEYFFTYRGDVVPSDQLSVAGHAEITGSTTPLVSGHVIVTPEPASMLLLGLASLFIRRR